MTRYRDTLLFLALAALWGGSFVAIEVGLDYYPPVLFAAYRFDLAAALLMGYVLLRAPRPHPRTTSDLLAILYSGGFAIAANNSLLFVGQQYTTSGIASIVYSLVPIMTAAVAAVVVGDSGLDLRGYLGVLLALVGVAFVSQPDPANLAGGVTVGVALIFVGVVFVAVGSVGLFRLETSFSSIELTAWALLFGALCMHLFSIGLGEPQGPPSTAPVALFALAFLGVFASALGYTVYFTLLDRLGAFQTNLVSYVVPVLATVAGAMLLAEPVTPLTVLGFCTIVLGFVLVKRRAIRKELPVVSAALRGRL